jgi:DNA polymerase I-like protein with 3'-5' exonuclease and polymerase domains
MRRLHDLGVPLILDHHDSLVAEVPEAEAAATAALMKREMELPIPELGGVQFGVDIKVSETWAG